MPRTSCVYVLLVAFALVGCSSSTPSNLFLMRLRIVTVATQLSMSFISVLMDCVLMR